MKVVLCTDGVFPLATGGMQRHSRLLAEHLARSGKVELTVLHPHAPGIFDPALNIVEVHVPAIDTDELYLRELWRYSERVGTKLEELRPDVILSQGFCVWKDMDRFSDKLIVHPHGLEMFQGLTRKERLMGAPFRWAMRHIVRRSKGVVSLGGKLTNILRHLTKGSGSEVLVIPNAVDVPEIRPLPFPISSSTLKLLFVGRFAFNKGIDVLIQVAERLMSEGRADLIRFELAGEGPLFEGIKSKGVPANVRLLGRVDDEQLDQLYRQCDAFLLPTRFEGMPTVVLEAMAQAKPIFVSDVGATAELVDMSNGYLLPPGDADALHRAIITFSSTGSEERERMGQESHRRALASFSWPSATGRFLKLFDQIAAPLRPIGKDDPGPVDRGPHFS